MFMIGYQSRDYYETKVDAYKEQIKDWYLNFEYDFNGIQIIRELKKIDY